MDETPLPFERISPENMRHMFNEGKFWERAQSGELTAVVERSRHPSLPLAMEPFCTQSQQVSYYDQNGNEVARVHQYLRPNGSIGASGKPDPKRIFKDGKLYRLQKAQHDAH